MSLVTLQDRAAIADRIHEFSELSTVVGPRLPAAGAQGKLRRRVVGWAVSDKMKKDLAIRALDMAVRLRQRPEAAFSIRIAAANIVLMTTRKG